MTHPDFLDDTWKPRRIISVVPSTSSVGGIAKILDYAVHAGRCGYESIFAPLGKVTGNENLFLKPYYLQHKDLIHVCSFDDITPNESDIILFSLPSNHKRIFAKYFQTKISCTQFIHIIQNVRHTNIYFDNNYSFRLLAKPLTRICITQQVYDEILPWVEDREHLHLIPHGFDFDFFAKEPNPKDPPSIAYNTFKGDFGSTIIQKLHSKYRRIKTQKIESGVSWDDLRSAYQNNPIFLGTPLREEGLYLPSLEAMAAGCAIIMPDAIGSRFYTLFGINCIETQYQALDDYVDALIDLLDNWQSFGYKIRQNAFLFAKRVGLEPEFQQFSNIVSQI